MQKICANCHTSKPAIDFQKHSKLCLKCIFSAQKRLREGIKGNCRQCTTCDNWKQVDQYHKNGSRLRRECKACATKRKTSYYWAKPEERRAASRRAYRQNRSASRRSYVRRTFGITLEEYWTYFEKANFTCQVCSAKPEKQADLHLDHCHSTGTIRGVLCRSCNHALGNVKDNPTTLFRLHAYLKKLR